MSFGMMIMYLHPHIVCGMVPFLHPFRRKYWLSPVVRGASFGADVVSLSELLGHADSSTTLRDYAHASEESQKRASD